jgi:hypothetical protein
MISKKNLNQTKPKPFFSVISAKSSLISKYKYIRQAKKYNVTLGRVRATIVAVEKQ